MCNVTNPIPASQIVNVDLEWGSLSAPTCLTLEHSLQQLIEEIELLKRPTLEDAACVTGVELGDIIQSIVTKICALDTTNTTESGENTVNSSFEINVLKSDNWVITDDCEIKTVECGVENKDSQIQALYSRMNSFCKAFKDQEEKIKELESKIEAQQLLIDNVQNCCE